MGRLNGEPGGNHPRLALSLDEAAEAIGVHRDSFDTHVLPRLRTVPVGRRRLVAVAELERYLDDQAL
jgi:hypothetical protein